MHEIELTPEPLSDDDNTINVEMSEAEICFVKKFIKEFNPKKIVEIGVSAGGNTINLLRWKDKKSQLFSVDISTEWYRDKTKLSGFMADELPKNSNWKMYRGYDYLEVYQEIGNNIDLIIIDTVHTMPGEFFSFIATLPQLKDGCVVILHDIHLNMIQFSNNRFTQYNNAAYCTGLLFGSVSSEKKWILKTDVSNIGAFIVDKNTKNNIMDIFHILCATWFTFPSELNLDEYSKYIKENYPIECYKLYENCLKLQSKYFDYKSKKSTKVKEIISTFLSIFR